MSETEWHLHVTVEPHWTWTYVDVQKALQREIERSGMKIVVATNYTTVRTLDKTIVNKRKELIHTKHHAGDEASANREIFKMGVVLNNAGWRVRRLKVEGDPRSPDVARRAMYFEAHLKIDERHVHVAQGMGFGISSTLKTPHYATIRSRTHDDVSLLFLDFVQECCRRTGEPCAPALQIEAITFDSNTAMDEDWLVMQQAKTEERA